jgi:hypothetical protein
VNRHDLIPHLFVHIDKCLVPEDTSVGDKNVDCAESINSSLDDSITIFGRTDGCDSLTSDCSSAPGDIYETRLTLLDLLDDGLGTFLGDIVDDNIGTQLSEHQCVASP